MSNENFYDFFGRRLKNLRKEKNITQADIAEILDVSPTTIVNYENGLRSMRFLFSISSSSSLAVVSFASRFMLLPFSLSDNVIIYLYGKGKGRNLILVYTYISPSQTLIYH